MDKSKNKKRFQLIITIVFKGFVEDVVEAAKRAGAEGSTIINGRGTGIHENTKLLGMLIEPEKEILLTLVPIEISANVLKAICAAGNLDQPNKGIAFVLDVEKVSGICHLGQKTGISK
jgi:nitrogen regulatory protein PII